MARKFGATVVPASRQGYGSACLAGLAHLSSLSAADRPSVVAFVVAKPDAKVALVLGEEDYTANIPLPDLLRPDVLFAFDHDGEPLTAEHGGPLRLIVPHLYAWKSVKWVRGFQLLDHDSLGFWERNGYHAYGDPWKEQRFSRS